MQTKYVPFIVLLVLASVAVPTAMGAPRQQVTLTVTVVDQSGDSVGGATLTASWEGGDATETTRSNGQALIDVPEGASIAIDVEDDEYVRNVPYIVAAADGGDVTVAVAKKGSATVRVESTAGEALSDARVTISRDGTTITHGTTNDNGGFYAETLERGDYQLTVVKPGYYAVERSLTVRSSFSLQPVTVEQGEVTARFRVVDDHFADPRVLEGATVKVGSLGRFNTSDDGTRAVSVPVNSEFEVQVSNGGYETTTESVTIGESDGTRTLAIQRTPALRVSPANSQVVVNQTVDVGVIDEYGDAVENATLRVGGTVVGTTDANGRVRIPIAIAGYHDLTAVKMGVSSESVAIEGVASARAIETTTTTETTTAEPPTAEPTTATDAGSAGTGPGFTGLLALVALVTTLGVLVRHR